MADKELIKKEIERRIEQCYRILSQDLLEIERKETNCCLQQYKELLKFIDSLTEEPANKDLEEAAEAFYNNCIEGILHKMSESKETFIAGAEWQKEKYNKQFGFLNLKDCKDAYNRWKSTQDNPSAALAWVRACEWQKQQMMRNAVEGISCTYSNKEGTFLHIKQGIDTKDGDKVKFVIVKTEQQ